MCLKNQLIYLVACSISAGLKQYGFSYKRLMNIAVLLINKESRWRPFCIVRCKKNARTISQSSLVLWFNPRLHDAMKFGAMLYISRANTGPEVTIYTTTAVILHIKHKQYIQNKNLCQSGNTFVYSIIDDPRGSFEH